MANISATLIKELREKTGAGMLDCKKALQENDGDMEAAIDFLRKKGIASAAKKSARLASEGLIEILAEGDRAVIVEVNSETDFVAKNENFQNFVAQIAQHVWQKQPQDLATMMTQTFADSGKDVQNIQSEMVAKIGENIAIRRFQIVPIESSERVGSYLHMGSKIGALVKVKADFEKVSADILKDIAMHIAATSPRFVSEQDISDDVKERERDIYRAQMKESGKPADILEKIIDGKMQKFAKEICLNEQIFVKDPEAKKSVLGYLKTFDPQAEIVTFVRFQVGEGMEKKSENFAEEVAKQIQGN